MCIKCITCLKISHLAKLYTHTLLIVKMLKSCIKISHLAKRVYTHTTYSANVEVMFKNQPSRQTCIHTHYLSAI